jgi:L-alanine-DL-glutamate epimerase-like enolase superfamily enzyme
MSVGRLDNVASLERPKVSAYRIPTDAPEADGTYAWNSTTLVLVEVKAGDQTGLGYTYADEATATLIQRHLADVVQGRDPHHHPRLWIDMVQSIRNVGRPGIASMAIAAVDVALWDVRAKLLGVSLATLLGCARTSVPVYGSGGFTSYSDDQLREQFSGWGAVGISRFKMKVGSQPSDDLRRVSVAREVIGSDVALFVDANGAYSCKQALEMAEQFATEGVSWFEEPVSSDDLAELRLLRERAPAGMEIAAGEYGYHALYFRRMLDAGAVDVLQADATRCGGITGFLQVAALCEAFDIDLSSHCAPALHLAACCAATRLRHMEYFHDHVRIEQMLFEGTPTLKAGCLQPDFARPGLGLEFRRSAAAPFAIDLQGA